jgi:hypothetical protein
MGMRFLRCHVPCHLFNHAIRLLACVEALANLPWSRVYAFCYFYPYLEYHSHWSSQIHVTWAWQGSQRRQWCPLTSRPTCTSWSFRFPYVLSHFPRVSCYPTSRDLPLCYRYSRLGFSNMSEIDDVECLGLDTEKLASIFSFSMWFHH